MRDWTKLLSGKRKSFAQNDPVFGSNLVCRFLNCFMGHGRGFTIERMYTNYFLRISSHYSFRILFFEAVELIRPSFELVRMRRGKANTFLPKPINRSKSYRLAIKYLYSSVDNQLFASAVDRLAEELTSIFLFSKIGDKLTESIISTKTQIFKNRGLKHFRWWV